MNKSDEDNYKHKNKYDRYIEKDLTIYNVWEDDWTFKRDIVKSNIMKIFGVVSIIEQFDYIIDTILDQEAEAFLNKNHIEGYTISDTHLGLFIDDKLYSIMSFKNSGELIEIIRHCDILNTVIDGSAQLLFDYFRNNLNSSKKDIMLLADNFWPSNLAENLGFDYVKDTDIDFTLVVEEKRINKSECPTIFEEFNRIYDSGKKVYYYSTF